MFVKGFIEALPLPDASVDAVLSNCVVNLSADKAAVFREAYRVLRPGGRLAISDVLRRGPPPGAASEEGWCACVDGAEGADAYLGHLGAAGFVDVRIEPPASGDAAPGTYSASVRAVRPALRPATSDDQAAIAALLESSGLPTDGLAAAVARAFVLEGGGALRGVVAFERYGEAALLRSLAVRADDRGRGYGLALVRHVEREARAAGATEAYALTTTVERWLPRLGYREVARVDLPAALRASPELRGACPASARAFAKALVGDG
jgi:N-acetylglutamate synthase-like GNAT family acetyltransferase